MKPNEYKKKRSAQYKKKHGANKDKQSKDIRQQKTGKTKVELNSETKTRDKTFAPSKQASREQDLESDSSGSDSETHQSEHVTTFKKSFSRRVVASNWDRYEIPPGETDKDVQQRGEDFSKLLSMAGAASSQFRFKEEEDWDDKVGEAQGSEVMSVDIKELSSRLQCIPLYKRIDVDKDLFTKTQISNMDDEADCFCKSYTDFKDTEEQKTDVIMSDNCKTVKNYKGEYSEHNKNGIQNSIHNNALNTHDANYTRESQKIEVENIVLPEISDLSVKVVENVESHLVNCSSVITTKHLAESNMDNIKNEESLTGEKLLPVSCENKLMLESELDSILDMDTPSEISTGITSKTEKTEVMKNETTDLEDWLDSVLDD